MWEFYRGSFTVGVLPWEFYCGNFTVRVLLWEFIVGVLPWEFYSGSFTVGLLLWEFYYITVYTFVYLSLFLPLSLVRLILHPVIVTILF